MYWRYVKTAVLHVLFNTLITVIVNLEKSSWTSWRVRSQFAARQSKA